MFSWTCCKKYFWVDCFHAVVSLWSRLCDGLAMVKTICYCTRFPPLIVEVSKGKSFGGLDYGPWRCGLDAHVSFCKCCLECPCSRGVLWAHFYWAYHLQYFWWFYLCFFFFFFFFSFCLLLFSCLLMIENQDDYIFELQYNSKNWLLS